MNKWMGCVFAVSLLSLGHAASKNQKALGELKAWHTQVSQSYSSIYEHVPVLAKYAKECSSVAEIGIQSVISTWGLLYGLAQSDALHPTYLGIDVDMPPLGAYYTARRLAQENGIDFTFWQANDMYVALDAVDLLFIDSLHTYCHLTYELETFSPVVNKYIIMHDTSPPWENQDDDAYRGDYQEYPAEYNRSKKGLWPAVIDFLVRHPEWVIEERLVNSHGLTVLRRVSGKL